MDLLSSGKYDLVLFTETWLNPGTWNSGLVKPGYEILQRDRLGLAHADILALSDVVLRGMLHLLTRTTT